MLQREVDVVADLRALRHGIQDVVSDGCRIQVEHPDPLEAVDLVQAAEESRQGAALAAVDAEERRVL